MNRFTEQSTPLVTVYIPTHNRAAMLVEAIDSVLTQSYKNIELIVVDDGSTDATETTLVPYINNGTVIYIKNDRPQGACVARNRAIAAAKGELITGLDDDDLFSPDRVKGLVEQFKSGKYSAVSSCIREVTSHGHIDRTFDVGEVSLDDLLFYNVLGNQVLTRTTYLREISGFDESMPSYQDYDTWVRLVEKFGSAYKLSDCSYLWRTSHEANRITTNSKKKIAGMEAFYSKHQNKMSGAHKKAFEIMRYRWCGQPYGLLRFISTVRPTNWRQAVTLFIDRNFPSLRNCLNKIRSKV